MMHGQKNIKLQNALSFVSDNYVLKLYCLSMLLSWERRSAAGVQNHRTVQQTHLLHIYIYIYIQSEQHWSVVVLVRQAAVSLHAVLFRQLSHNNAQITQTCTATYCYTI